MSAATPAPPPARNGTAAAIEPLPDSDPYGPAPGGIVQPRPCVRGGRGRRRAHPSISRDRASIARSRPASPCARPVPPTSVPRTGSSSSTRRSASAASCARGRAPMARADSDADEGVVEVRLVHRWHLQRHLPEEDRRRPASWCARSTLGISVIWATLNSAVSQMVAQRRGTDLMPELGYKPVNKYLPPRPERMGQSPPPTGAPPPTPAASSADKLLRWVDRLLSR